LYDRWVDGHGIRCDQIYHVLVQTDLCSQHALEKYRTQLHIVPAMTEHEYPRQNCRLLSRGAFLSMFQNERNHVIQAMMSLVEKYRKKKTTKHQKQGSSNKQTPKKEHINTSTLLLTHGNSSNKSSVHTVEPTVDDLPGTIIITSKDSCQDISLDSNLAQSQRRRASTEYHSSSQQVYSSSKPFHSTKQVEEIIENEFSSWNTSSSSSHYSRGERRKSKKTNIERKGTNSAHHGKWDAWSDMESTCPSTESNEDSLSSISMYSTAKAYSLSTTNSTLSEHHPSFLQSDRRAVSNPEERLHCSDRRMSSSSLSRQYRSRQSDRTLSLYSSQPFQSPKKDRKYRSVPSRNPILNHDDDNDDECICCMLNGVFQFIKDLFSSRPATSFDWSKIERNIRSSVVIAES